MIGEAKVTTNFLEKLEELRQLHRSGKGSIVDALQTKILGEWARLEGSKFALNSEFDKTKSKVDKLETTFAQMNDKIISL